jgi:NAD dependent epimerase/dehydratase family
MRLLVCGGAGFIGSTFVRLRVREHGHDVTVLDKLTYAGGLENLESVSSDIRFVHGAIEDPEAVLDAVAGCDAIVNFAAETQQRHQDGGGPAGIELLPHVRPQDADLSGLKQLRSASVPREADPIDDSQRAGRRLTAGLRRRAKRA